MALGDTLDKATENVPNVDGAVPGDVVPTDPAKTDVQGNRKTDGAPTTGTSGTNSGGKDSSLKIKIELDIDIEVHLTARIKGDITIGLL